MDVKLELGTSGGDLLNKLKELRAGLDEQKKATEAVGKANQEAAQAGIKAGDEWIAKMKEMLAIQSQQNERIERQRELIKEMRAEMDRLRQTSSGTFNPADVKRFEDEIRRLRSEIEALKNAKKGAKAEPLFTPGSLLEAEATVKRLRLEISQLGPAARKSAVGKELVAELKLAEAELTKIQRQIGIAAAQAGNVVNKSWSFLRQAAYILPGIGVAGIIGIFSEGIANLANKIFDFGEKYKSLTDIIAESGKEYQSASTNVRLLQSEIDAAKKGFISKDGVVKHYNETIGKTVGLAKDLDEAEQLLNKNAAAYIKFTFLKSVANHALEESTKAAFEAQKIQQKEMTDFITTASKMQEGLTGGFGNALVPGVGQDQRNIAEANLKLRAQKEKDALVKSETDKANAAEKIYNDFFNRAAKLAHEKGFNFFDDTKEGKEKQLQLFKDRSDKIIALEKQLADARIAIMQDGRKKEIAVENARNEDMVKRAVAAIEKYEAEIEKVRTSKKSETDKAKEIAQLTDLIRLEYEVQQQELITHNAKLLAIDLKYYESARKALEDSQTAIEDIVLKDQDKEINALNKKYEKLFKAIADARKKALEATDNPIVQAGINFEFDDQITRLTEQQEKERLEITKKYNLKRIKEQEDLGVAEAGVIQKNGANAEELEKIRQIAVLKVQIEAAKARIELLKSSGSDEDKLLVAQNQAFIEKALLSIQKLGAEIDKKNGNIFGLSNKEMRDMQTATRAVSDSILSIWKDYVDSRVSQQERLMRQLESDIEKQERLVDKEKDLKEKGYANNYDIEERKLNDLKRRNSEEAEQMKKLQKEQAAYAKAQQIISGTVAATKLGVAAATYFAEGSQYGPVVGVALALAAIATMVATFASIKNQSKELANFQTYRDGGEFDARGNYPTHEQGGLNVVDSRSGKKLAEFEKNEYAYFFRDGAKAKQFKPLFDKINKGELSDWRVSPIGLQVPETTLKGIVVHHQTPAADNKHLASIDKNVKKLANHNKTTVEYHNGYRIEKTGNHTRKIRTKDEG